MSGTSLRDFVLRAVEHKRKRFGDLRRLQRDILPARITTREQAKVLIALDSSVDRAARMYRRPGCPATSSRALRSYKLRPDAGEERPPCG
jgi:hypothetical protein